MKEEYIKSLPWKFQPQAETVIKAMENSILQGVHHKSGMNIFDED